MNKSKRKTDVFFCIICVPRGALNLAPLKKKKKSQMVMLNLLFRSLSLSVKAKWLTLSALKLFLI